MNLEIIEDTIVKFLETNKEGMIVINGLEVLEMWNGFMPIVKMVERLKLKLVEPDKAILISLDPKNLVSNNLTRLERVSDVVVASA
jgi:archaellum biogenesis ATPase FlaH